MILRLALFYNNFSISRIVVCVGGHLSSHGLETYSFATDQWTLHSSAQTGFPSSKLVGVTSHNKRLYFMGRFDFGTGAKASEVYEFNPDSVTVSQIGALAAPMTISVLIVFNVA